MPSSTSFVVKHYPAAYIRRNEPRLSVDHGGPNGDRRVVIRGLEGEDGAEWLPRARAIHPSVIFKLATGERTVSEGEENSPSPTIRSDLSEPYTYPADRLGNSKRPSPAQ